MRSLISASPFLLAAAIAAQVPVGSAINGSIGSSATPLVVVNRTPAVTNITGAVFTNINGLRIDPITGAIWMVGTGSADLRRGNVNFGTGSFVNDTVAGTLPVAGAAAIAFDIDCNPVVGGGVLTGTGGVFRVDRNSGVVTTLVNSASGLTGTVNAIDEDAATGDLYFGVFGNGNVYRITPPYALNSQTLVGSIAGSVNANLSGVSYVRPPAAPLGILYISAFAGAANASLSSMDPATGAVTVIPGTPAWYDANWVDYDTVLNDLWTNSTFAARSLSSSTLAGVNTLVHQIPSGTPACIEVNDVDTARAELRVCPMNVPTLTAPVRLEMAVAGNPGEIGVIAIIAPVLSVLGIGPVGPDGLFTVSFPNVTVPSGSPGLFRFLAGTVDSSTLAVKLSLPVPWPRN